MQRPSVARARGLFAWPAAILLAAGCVSTPHPAYLKVDSSTPEFHAAVAREAANLRAAGKSPQEARSLATQRTINRQIAEAKAERAREVAPLKDVLSAPPPATAPLPAPSPPGTRPKPVPDSWAYTLSSTIRQTDKKGTKTIVTIERFDPSQPEERLWTEVSVDGRAPSDEDQAKYRATRLKRWKQEQAREARNEEKPMDLGWLGRQSDLKVSPPDRAGWVAYAFTTDPIRVTGLGTLPASRRTYTIDPATKNLMAKGQEFQGAWSLLFGAIKFTAFAIATDYRVERADLPSVPSRAHAHMALRGFGRELDLLENETYSDYKRVVSYDKRFVVWIETPTEVDLTGAPGLLREGN